MRNKDYLKNIREGKVTSNWEISNLSINQNWQQRFDRKIGNRKQNSNRLVQKWLNEDKHR